MLSTDSISIIMPAFNAEKTITRAIESIQKQTYKNWQLIIVNDGSKDATQEIIQQKCREDSRIEGYLIENSGPAQARNYALEHAKGKWVAFCDADDWLTENALEIMVTFMNGVSFQLCACYYTSNCNNNEVVYLNKQKAIFQFLTNPEIGGYLWNKLFLRKIIETDKIRFKKDAASVNTATYNEDVCDDQLRKNILDFDYISIREHSGAKKISHFLNTDKQVKVQPDPSLLQTKEVFAAIASKRIVEKPYIFMYCANYQESTIRTAQKVSKLLEKPVYTVLVCRSATQIAKLKESGIRIIRDKNRPEDFLSFVMNSDLVLSDSFHGTAFSIIFEKKFFSVNDYINGEYVDDERIRNILGELGIPERYIKEEDIQNLDFQKEIDYTVVTGKRLELAENAIKDITKAIED